MLRQLQTTLLREPTIDEEQSEDELDEHVRRGPGDDTIDALHESASHPNVCHLNR